MQHYIGLPNTGVGCIMSYRIIHLGGAKSFSTSEILRPRSSLRAWHQRESVLLLPIYTSATRQLTKVRDLRLTISSEDDFLDHFVALRLAPLELVIFVILE